MDVEWVVGEVHVTMGQDTQSEIDEDINQGFTLGPPKKFPQRQKFQNPLRSHFLLDTAQVYKTEKMIMFLLPS